MEIEDRIRTRIEAILVNDARNFSEIKKAAADDEEPLEADILADERNLYHRIINSYRNAVGEVNKLLEENIGSLSGFYRIVESIKEKEDFQEICSQIVNCILQDFGADYCSLLFPENEDTLCLEGICEERKFLRIHSKTSLLGSKVFERELTCMAEENADCLNIEDVYKEPRFNAVDFPGVVRSVLCLPLMLRNQPAGFLVLSHSLPSFFHDNHIRVLKILGSLIAHLRLLHLGGRISHPMSPPLPSAQEASERPDVYAVVLMDFDALDTYGRRMPLEKEYIREIRMRIHRILEARETVLFYGEKELLVFMPGVSSESLPGRIRSLREAFHQWRKDRFDKERDARINLGFSVCEGEEDLERTLEVAALVMHPDDDEIPENSAD
jgi:transcriptional regulator with GAF, ATPase, and Fis domain